MRLIRVRVPDFKVLKNIDIVFEPDFEPNLFPLASLNGGGKSTLLQLIFVLLHCVEKPERHEFVKNMLEGFEIEADKSQRELAIFDVLVGDEVYEIKFFYIDDAFLQENIDKESSFNSFYELNNLLLKRLEQQERLKESERVAARRLERIDQERAKSPYSERERELEHELKQHKYERKRLELFEKRVDGLKATVQYIENILSENGIYLLTCFLDEKTQKSFGLVYSVYSIKDNDTVIQAEKIKSILNELSEKVFLAAPSTQIFHFLSTPAKALLFQQSNIEATYESELIKAKRHLNGFFTFEFASVDSIIALFKSAQRQDFAGVVKQGQYGSRYKELVAEMSALLAQKAVKPELDKEGEIIGVRFEREVNGEMIELTPSNLSHGELRKLSLYAWLKSKKIENAIVLIDEIEIALHPDWQYAITRSLIEWKDTNQYIIATHSYDVCEAVTPAHVKQIEPKLRQSHPEDLS